MRRTLLNLTLLSLSLLLLHACNRSEEQIVQLQSKLDSLESREQEKDQIINDFFKSLEQIEKDLALVRAKEKKLGEGIQLSEQVERREDNWAKIEQGIVEINEIMAKNRSAIADLSSKLKKSNLKVAYLEKVLADAQQKIAERDSVIAVLHENLANLNVQVDSLNQTVNTLDSTNRELSSRVSMQHAALDEAWYAFGSKKELKENNVISASGGFLGIGKHHELKGDFDTSYFTRISIEATGEIELFASKKGVELVTSHPSSSYELVRNEHGAVERIRILDKTQFWRSSRFLVIIIN